MANRKITIEADIKVNEQKVKEQLRAISSGIEKLQGQIKGIAASPSRNTDVAQSLIGNMRDAVKQMEEMKKKYQDILQDISEHKINNSQLNSFVSGFEERFKAIEQRMASVEELTTKLNKVIKGLSVNVLKGRFDELEKTVSGFKTMIGDAITALSTFNDMVQTSAAKPKETKFKVDASEIKKVEELIEKMQDTDNILGGKSGLKIRMDTALKQITELYDKYQLLSDSLSQTKDPRELANIQIAMAEILPDMGKLISRVLELKKVTSAELSEGVIENMGVQIKNMDFTEFFNKIETLVGRTSGTLSTLRDQMKKNLSDGVQQATTEVSQFTFKNGGIRIPVTVDASSATALQKRYNEIVALLQQYADVHPVNVTMRLFPLNANRTNAAEVTTALKNIQTDISSVDDPALREKLNSLYNDLEAQFKKALNLKVKVDLGDNAASLKQRIKDLATSVQQEGFTIYPKFDIKDDEADKISQKLDEIQKKFTFDVASQITKMSDSLNALLSVEKVDAWRDAFNKALTDLNSQLSTFQQALEPLFNIISSKSKGKGDNLKSNVPTPGEVNLVVEFTNAMTQLQQSLQKVHDFKLDIDIAPLAEKLDILKATIQVISGKLSILPTLWNEIKSLKSMDGNAFMSGIQETVSTANPIVIPITPDLSGINEFVDKIRLALENANLGVNIRNVGFNESERKSLSEMLQNPNYANAMFYNIDKRLEEVAGNIGPKLRQKISESLVVGLRDGISSVPEMIESGLRGTSFESISKQIIGDEETVATIRNIANEVAIAFQKAFSGKENVDINAFISGIENAIQSSGQSVKLPISVLETSIDTLLQEAQNILNEKQSLKVNIGVATQEDLDVSANKITSLNKRVGNLQKKVEETWQYWHEFAQGATSATSIATSGLIDVINKLQELYLRLQEIATEFPQISLNPQMPGVDTAGNQAKAESAKMTAKEAKAMSELYDKALKAAEAKQVFTDANRELLSSIIESLKGLNSEGTGFDNLNKLINNLANNKNDRITNLVENLRKIREVLSESVNENAFVNAIKDIAKSGDSLKDLATVLRASRTEIEKAKSASSSSDSAETKNIKERIATINRLNELYAYTAKHQDYDKNDPRIANREQEILKLEEYLEKLEQVKLSEEQLKQVQEGTYKSSMALMDAEAEAAARNADAKKKAADEATKAREKETKELEQQARTETRIENRRVDLLNRISKLMSRGQIEKVYGNELNALSASLQQLPNDAKVADAALTEIYQRLAQIESQANLAGKAGSSFGQILSKRWKSVAAYLGSFASFYRIVGYVRNAFTTLKDLDTQLVDLRKTTTMNTAELNSFYRSATEVGKELGVTTSEIIQQAAAWSRLGYSSNEAATQMAKLSSQFAAISPGMDVSAATDGLVSTMKAFGYEVDEVLDGIMSKINIIGNTAATSNQEIVDMLQRSSSAMAEANNTLEETIALETAAVEITRNAESTGTAFKTIAMRIRGYDEEGEMLEDYEELKGKIADLTKTAKNPGGISLFTDASKTEFKSTYQLLKDIHEIYSDLTDKQQAGLLEALGGKRGGQVVGSMLRNWEAVEKAMDNMENSAGAADAEMEIVKQSLEYKINALKQTWTGFLQDSVSRKSLGGFVDGLTNISEVFTTIINKLGIFKTLLVTIGTIWGSQRLGILNYSGGKFSSSLSNIINPIKNAASLRIGETSDFLTDVDAYGLDNLSVNQIDQFATAYKGLNKNAVEYVKNVKLGNIQLQEGQTILQGYSASVNLITKLGNAFATLGKKALNVIGKISSTLVNGVISYGLSMLVANIATGIFDLIGKIFEDGTEEIIEAGTAAEDKIDELTSTYKSHKKTVEELSDKYTELAQGVKDLGLVSQSQGSLSTDEYKEFLDISNQLAGIFPSLKKGITEEGDALLDLNGDAQTISNTLKELLESERGFTALEVQKQLPEIWAKHGVQVNSLSDQYNEAAKNLQIYQGLFDKLQTNDYETWGQFEAYEGYKDYLEKIFEENGLDFNDYINSSIDSVDFKKIFPPLIEKYQNEVDKFGNQIQSENRKLANYISSSLVGDTVYDSLTDGAKNLVNNVLNAIHYDSDYNTQRDSEDWDDVYTNIKDRTLGVISKLEAGYPEIADKFGEYYARIFNWNNSDETAANLLEQYQFIVDTINNLDISDEDKQIFLKTLPSDKEIKDKIDHVKTIMGENWDDNLEKVLTAKDLQVLAKISVDENSVALTKADIEKILNPIELDTQIKPSSIVDSMADMKSAVGTLDDLWRQTVENQLKLGKDKKYLSEDGTVTKEADTKNMAVGSADPALLKSVNSAFNSFITTLSDDDAKKSVAYALEDFNKVMTETPGDAKAAQKAINKLITAYIDQGKVLENLDESNKQWHIDQLKAMGVTNAQEVVETRLIKTNKKLLESEKKLADIFRKNYDALSDVNVGTAEYEKAAQEIVTELTSMFNEETMGFTPTFDVNFVTENLELIRDVASGDVEAIAELRRMLTEEFVAKLGLDSHLQEDINKELSGLDIPDLWATAKLDTHPFIQGLNALLKAGKITRDQMNAILSGIGVKPKITYEDVEVTQTSIQEAEEAMGLEGSGAAAYEQSVKTLAKISIPRISYEVGAVGAEYEAPSVGGDTSGSGSSSSGSHANKVNKDSEESFDWIEVKIQRLNEEISRLDKTVGDVYENWSERNSSLEDELDKVAEEMAVHQHAYERYLANANAVKVSNKPKEEDYEDNEKQYEYDLAQYNEAVRLWNTGDYKRKIQEGLIGAGDIEKIQNKYLVDTINEYTELYQKAVDAGDAIQDDKIKLGELNRTRFDHIKTEYEELISGFEHLGNVLDQRISRMEEHGYFVNANYYKRQLQNEQKHYDKLTEEYNKLTDARQQALDSGAIELNSEAYHEMTSEINSVAEAIEESASNTVKWQKAIRDLGFEIFEWIEEKVTNISTEIEFLVGLLGDYKLVDEQGYLNDRGYATLGLHTSQYNIAMKQAEDYRDKILEIQQELVDDPSNKEKLDQLDEYKQKEQESIKAAQSAAENIKSLWSDAFSAQLDYLQKLMDKYKKTLSNAKDLYSYQKNIANQTDNISSLEKQLQAYSGDVSEETRATVQNLRKQLEDARTNLQETEWDRYISETEKVLDDMYDEYETMLNERLDDIYGIVAESVEMTNANSGRISDGIEEVTNKWGYALTEQTSGILAGNTLVSNYTNGFENYSANVLTYLSSFEQSLNKLATDAMNMAKVDNEGLSSSVGTWNKNDKGWWYQYGNGKYPKNQWLKIDGEWYYFDENGYMVTGERMINGEKHFFTNSGKWTKNYGKNGYATGSSHIPYDQLAWTQEQGSELIFRASDGAMLTPLNKGDMVFTNDMTKNLWDLAKNPALTGATVKLPESALTARTVNNENAITVVLPNVQSYDDFKQALMKDKQITNFMQSVTIGQALGKGKLNRGNM